MNNIFKILALIATFTCVSNYVSAQYAIGEIDDNGGIVDPSRSNRTIWTHYYYPATSAGTNTTPANGQFPLIVFGHGFVMAYSEYKSIADTLVPKGYVVVFPRTEGNLFSTNHENFAKDISFLVDYFQTQSQSNTAFKLYGKLIDKTAIMGHSMGGGASVWSVANNQRVTTMCTLAPVNTSDPVQSIVWAPNITKPSLIVTGSRDCVADGSQSSGNGDDIYDAMTNTSLPYKYTVKITEANHCNFASNPGGNCTFGETSSGCRNTGLTLSNQQKIMFNMVKPWLDYHLKGICSSWNLFTNYVTTAPATTLTYRNQGNPVFPVANAGIDATLTCTNTSATLGSTALSGMTYSWSNAATTAVINVNTPGTYTVTVTSVSNGCTATDQTIVTSNTTPPTANAGNDAMLTCTNTSATLGSSAQSGMTYLWSNGGTTATINVTTPNTYIVTVTNTANGCFSTDQVIISENVTAPSAFAGNDNMLNCDNTSFTIGGAATTGFTYLWSNGSTTSTINVNAADTYSLTVTNSSNGCNATDDVVISSDFSLPPTPTINSQGNTLTTSVTNVTYQWNIGNTPIALANQQSYTPLTDGIYTVTVRHLVSGCTATSAPFNFIITNVITINGKEITINNPVKNEIVLSNLKEQIPFSIFDISGNRIAQGFTRGTIEVSKLSKGIYFVRLNENAVFRIFKD